MVALKINVLALRFTQVDHFGWKDCVYDINILQTTVSYTGNSVINKWIYAKKIREEEKYLPLRETAAGYQCNIMLSRAAFSSISAGSGDF